MGEIPNGSFYITNINAKKVLACSTGNTGSPVVLQSKGESDLVYQSWTYDSGTNSFVNVGSGFALSVKGGSTEPEKPLIVEADANRPDQKWIYIKDDKTIQLKDNKQRIIGFDDGQGAVLRTRTDPVDPNNLWKFEAIEAQGQRVQQSRR
ncbi:uncharacterized protein LOC144906910 [Branchiostoma floridae x Branchiostoma belcheri]